jgi:hypothetical protein
MSRSYDTQLHRRLRRNIAAKVAAGGVLCWRCEEGAPGARLGARPGDPANEIAPGEPWDLGHDDDTGDYRGPEHADCSRRAGVRKREAGKAAPPVTRLGTRSRAW